MARTTAKKKAVKRAPKKPSKELNIPELEEQLEVERQAEKSSSPVILMISGEISKEHEGIVQELMTLHYRKDFNDVVTLLINSEGGDAAVGWAIIDTMNFVRFPIQTTVIGQACSAAADIFVNGDIRTMGANSILMVHDAAFGQQGSYHDLVAARKYHEIEYAHGIRHYISNSKYKSEDDVKKNILTGRDMFFDPEEAVKHGLADHIAGQVPGKREKMTRFLSSK